MPSGVLHGPRLVPNRHHAPPTFTWIHLDPALKTLDATATQDTSNNQSINFHGAASSSLLHLATHACRLLHLLFGASLLWPLTMSSLLAPTISTCPSETSAAQCRPHRPKDLRSGCHSRWRTSEVRRNRKKDHVETGRTPPLRGRCTPTAALHQLTATRRPGSGAESKEFLSRTGFLFSADHQSQNIDLTCPACSWGEERLQGFRARHLKDFFRVADAHEAIPSGNGWTLSAHDQRG